MALAKRNRLNRDEIKKVFQKGKTVKNSFFFIHYLPNTQNYLQLAVVVPLVVAKKATARNQIKRKLTAVARSFLNYPIKMILKVAPTIVDKPASEIKNHFELAIKRIFVNTEKK